MDAELTAKARTEQSSVSPQCASSSDTVREIKYQILHRMPASGAALTTEGNGGGPVHKLRLAMMGEALRLAA